MKQILNPATNKLCRLIDDKPIRHDEVRKNKLQLLKRFDLQQIRIPLNTAIKKLSLQDNSIKNLL